MTKFLRKYGNAVMLTTLVAMMLSIVGYGGYLFTMKDTSDAAAIVGGTKIPYVFYSRIADQTLDQYRKEHKEDVSDATAKEIRREVLQNLVTSEMSAQEAERLGMHVSDEELAWAIQHDPSFQTEGGFNQSLYVQMVVQGYNTTVEDYERRRRRELLSSKYQYFLFNRVKMVPSEIKEEYKQSHNGSDKNFEKDKEKFTENLYRIRSLYTLQTALRKALGRIEVHSYIDEREGAGG